MVRKRDPFKEIEEIFQRMSSGFEDIGEEFETKAGIHVDVAEEGGDVVVTADLPGYDRENIDVTVEDRRLRIAAEKGAESEEEDKSFYRRERRRESVSRTVRLPVEVEEERSTATYENGVLTIRLPKEEEEEGEEGHSIDIN